MSVNPILIHELRVRMRGATAYSLLTAIILVFGAFTLATYWTITNQIRPVSPQITSLTGGTPNPTAPMERLLIAERGSVFFLVMVLWAVAMVAFIIPASTSGSISREREQHSLELLAGSPIAPLTIVIGKLLGAVSYVLLLLAAAIPLFSLVIMFGGIAVDQAVNAAIVVAVTTFAFGAMGVFISALTRNSLLASLLTYTLVLVLTFGSYAIYLASSPLSKAVSVKYILYFSPLAAALSAVTQTNARVSGLVTTFFREPGARAASELWSLGHYPLWYVTAIAYLLGGALLIFAASRLIDPLRRWL